MPVRLILLEALSVSVIVTAANGQSAANLFQEAETLGRDNRKQEALAKIEAAVAELQRIRTAGQQLEYADYDRLRSAVRMLRENFADYDRALFYCEKLFALATDEGWQVNARLERALTYRAMQEFDKAQAEYDAIAAADDPRNRAVGLLPQAEMVYFDLHDEKRGRPLMVAALKNGVINGYLRFSALRNCAQQALAQGRFEDALRCYAMIEEMPFDNPRERAGFLSWAWYEMGQIEETRGRIAQAKSYYRRTVELTDGEMRFRARARDALEGIEYFE